MLEEQPSLSTLAKTALFEAQLSLEDSTIFMYS
jgi:hypothetical protein